MNPKTSLNIKVKKVGISDIESFWNFFKKSIKTRYPDYSEETKNFILRKSFSKKNFLNWLKRKEKIILIAFLEKKPIGFLLANLPYGGVVFLHWIVVREEIQKRGIGSLLLKRCEKIAKKQKVHKIYLWSAKRNVKFFKMNGYKLGGYIPKFTFNLERYLLYKDI